MIEGDWCKLYEGHTGRADKYWSDSCSKYMQVCTSHESQWVANEEKQGYGECARV